MTGEEVVRLARRRLDDLAEPYLWEDVELVDYLNRSINEICEKTELIRDSSTTAIVQIKLLANLGKYSLDTRVIRIFGCRLTDRTLPLTLATETFLDRFHSNWRAEYSADYTGVTYIVPLIEGGATQSVQFVPYIYDATGYIAGASDITFTTPPNLIYKVGATFTDHFETGDSIYVSGTTSNDGYKTVVTVAATDIIVSETLVAEASTSAVIRRVENTATMTVARYPSAQFTSDNLTTQAIEIPFAYHSQLIEGIMMHAYEKDDADTLDIKKADRARLRFMKTIDDLKRLHIRRFHAPGAVELHKGAI